MLQSHKYYLSFFLFFSAIVLANPINKQNISTKVIELDNQMKVMLISDPSSQFGAASLTLPVGQRNSPKSIDGLPHALEHAVFLGSQKYSSSDGFMKFIKKNQGWSNASTRSDNTRYHFQVNPNALEKGLDRLSDFLFNPLLLEKAVAISIAEVDEEFEAKKHKDWQKVLSVIRAKTNPNHPASKFGIGNKKSLFSDIKTLTDNLSRFHKTFYQPQNMTLAIYGPQSINELRLMAVEFFSIPSSNGKPTHIELPELFLRNHLGSLIQVQTNQNTNSLDIRFKVPPKHIGINPQLYSYMRTLLESQVRGGIIDRLKQKDLATNLLIYSQGNRHYGLFDVYIDLTPHGKGNINLVLTTLFDYITFLKTTPHPTYIQAELKSLELIDNERPITKDAGDWVSDISDTMQIHDSKNWINSFFWESLINQADINHYLNYFSIEKAQVLLSSNTKLDSPSLTSHFAARYKTTQNLVLNKINSNENIKTFSFPSKNKYLALFKPKYLNSIESSEELIESTKQLNIYAATNKSEGTVKMFTTIEIDSNFDNSKDFALMEMFSTYLEDTSSIDSEHATLAGYRSYASVQHFGIRLNLSGDYSGFDFFLNSVIKDRLLKKPNKKAFSQLKAKTYSDYEDRMSTHTYRQAFSKIKHYALNIDAGPKLRLNEINNITYKQFLEFRNAILSNSNFDIQFVGPLSPIQFKKYFAESIDYLKSVCTHTPKPIIVKPQSSQKFNSVVSIVSDAVSLAWVETNSSIKDRAIQSVLKDIFKQPFHNHMRADLKLAYYASTSFLNYENSALTFTVQSSKSTPETLLNHIESYIKNFSSDYSKFKKELENAKVRILLNPFIKPSKKSSYPSWIRNINRLGYQTDEFMEDYLKEVESLSVDDLQTYIAKHLNVDKTQIK